MIYYITSSICYLVFKIFFSLKVAGLGNIPLKGPFIIACNHASYIDPVIIGGLKIRKISFMAKEELFKNKFFAWYLSKLHIFPLRRYSGDSRALRGAIRRLKKGGSLLIFPEGTRSRDGKLQEFRRGGFFLAQTSQSAIIPISLEGTYELMPKGSFFVKKGKIKVFFHPAVSVLGNRKEDLPALLEEVRGVIRSGLAESENQTRRMG